MRILVIAWEYPPYVVGGLGKHVSELVPMLTGVPGTHGRVHVDLLTVQQTDVPISLGQERPSDLEHIGKYLTVHRVNVAPDVSVNKAVLEPPIKQSAKSNQKISSNLFKW